MMLLLYQLAPPQNCTVTMIDGGVKRHLVKRRARIRFKTDGDPMATYRCRLDGEELSNCKLHSYVPIGAL